jgi:adenine-specific DNA-methyltransferase
MPNYRAADFKVRRLQRVRSLRRESTDAERAMWKLLRAGQIGGYKFRRQHEFSGFILDFFCASEKLAVEVDGSQHFSEDGAARDRDMERTAFLEANGIRVLRFTNVEVLTHIDLVGEVILRELG